MTVDIRPGKAAGTVIAPPSKSVAHRLLICAGLSEGQSVVRNVAFSEDILATLDVLKAMGARIETSGDSAAGLARSDLKLHGTPPPADPPRADSRPCPVR